VLATYNCDVSFPFHFVFLGKVYVTPDKNSGQNSVHDQGFW